jgi:hypothetical protein
MGDLRYFLWSECDKSFTRSDALAKHVRLLHSLSPPAPGRGGNRKRKRDASVAASEAHTDADSSIPATSVATNTATPTPFNSFKVEPRSPEDEQAVVSFGNGNGAGGDYFTNGYARPSPGPENHNGEDDSDEEDGLPDHLLAVQDPATGLIMGRSPSMVRYLLVKAKHRYALQQHEHLIEELRVTRWELKHEREVKERALDDVLRNHFG